MPHSSLRPKKSDAPRWGQLAAISPTSPRVSRKATRSSPSRRTFLGGQSGSGSSVEGRNGIQYWRSRSPIAVPRPTRHISSLSSFESIAYLHLEARLGRRGPSPATACRAHGLLEARLGRRGPSPATACRPHGLLEARLGRRGPRPANGL